MTMIGAKLTLTLFTACAVIMTSAGNTPSKKLADANNNFALKLYKHQVSLGGRWGNVFFSPISISMAAGLVNLAAKGDTKVQLGDVLGFKNVDPDLNQAFLELTNLINDPTNNFTLKLANRAYADQSANIEADYKTNVENYFKAVLEQKDFAGNAEGSRAEINKWVADYTMDKIKDLIPQGAITPATIMVLVNAVYFKAGWVNIFDKDQTKKDTFQLSLSNSYETDMMQYKSGSENLDYYQIAEWGCKILALPYLGNKVDMYVLVPDAVDGLPDVENKLNFATLNDIIENKMSSNQVVLTLPKFKLTLELDLKAALQKLGVIDLFDGEKADLSGMSSKKKIAVTDAFHKAFIDVNEVGTEAAAATSFVVGVTGIMQPTVVKVDRPFLFLIRERSTGTVLFMGKLATPAGAEALTLALSNTSNRLQAFNPTVISSIALFWSILYILSFVRGVNI